MPKHGDQTYEPLSKMVRLRQNPKNHDIGLLHQSIGRWGYLAPITRNIVTGNLLAGHGRIDTLQQRKVNADGLPQGVRERDGEWEVPTFWVEVPEEEETEVAIGLNKTEEAGGWDEELLAQQLSDRLAQGSTLEGTGFDADDVDALIAFAAFSGEGNEGELPDVQGYDEPDSAFRVILVCEDGDTLDQLKGALGLSTDSPIQNSGEEVLSFLNERLETIEDEGEAG